MAPLRVIIVGGGLAGTLLANALQRHGIDFTIYERDERGSKREGYQIRLGAAALVGFRACLEQAQIDELMKKFGRSGGLISSAPILYDTSFNCLIDLTRFPAYTKSAPINRVVLRDFLAQPIDDAGNLQYKKRFVKYDIVQREGKSKVVAHFDDGTTDEGDLLISAEGSGSKVNGQIGLANIVQLHDKWGFLAKASLPPLRLLALAPEVRKAPVSCIKNGVILFFSAYMPDASNATRHDETTEDGTTKIEDYDINSASVFWGLTVPAELVPKEGGSAIANKLDFCLDIIKSWDPKYHDMLKVIDDESDIYTFQARASTEPTTNWREKQKRNGGNGIDQVWLMGDAIHPMLPSRGMGANQAMHDAADILPAILDLNERSKSQKILSDGNFAAAVKQYESKMMPRAFGWVKTSGGTGSQTFEPESLKGKIALFFVARALDVTWIYSSIRRWSGWVPQDDAPELPN
ncbi:hypothetical protein VE03_06891 [Pseudogymnoascus sp. 23342-1-I1]|nr:hypothetical protein VE03_06891 [Pseudogymnoascus sp. 23342-1-I1]